MSWWVYIVRDRKGRLYTGITTDVTRRVKEHNTDKAKAAKALWPFRPVTLCWSQQQKDRGAAAREEARIKKLSVADKRRLINPLSARLQGV